MSTPPKTPDEDSDEDVTMLNNLTNATDKYEAAIAIQPETARPLNTNKQPYHHRNNMMRNPYNLSANRVGDSDQNEDEDEYESDNIEDKDIDNLKKLRINRHSHTKIRDDCIDDFITYNVTPALKRRPTYEECLDDQNEDDPLQLNAAMIQPISEPEKEETQSEFQTTSEITPKIEVQPHVNPIGTWLLASTAANRNAAITESSSSLTPREETKRLSLVCQVSRHIDEFLRQQGASDLMMPWLCQTISPNMWFRSIRATIANILTIAPESDVLQFQKDDIPPETLDATTHSTLMDLWTQRMHIEETLENLLNNSLDIDIDDEFERLDDIHNTINRQMFDTYRLSTFLVHENNLHKHPPQMLITDPTLIERYNDEIPPSARTLISDWNRSQDTSSEATQKSKGARTTSYDTKSPKENTKQLVSLENDDTTEFVTGKKRPAIENTESIEPDPKRIGIEPHALMIRSLNNKSKQIAHDTNKISTTMVIDSGASHILVRQEHANILNNITMFEPNAEPVMHLQTAKKGSTLHAIGQGLLYIGNFHLRAYIFKNDELNTSLLGLNPLTAQGCSATFTHESFNLHHGPNPVPILSGYKHTTQDTWQVQINQIESFTPNDHQKAWNPQSLDIASFYITTPLLQTLGKQRVFVPRKQRVSAKLRKSTSELSAHAESTSFHMAEIHRILDIITRSPISAPVKYYVKQLDFRSERLYRMTRGRHTAPDSDIQMDTAISPEPSQLNLNEYPRVTDVVINYTPQMDLNNIFTKTLPELQYDELLQCVSIDSQ